MTSQPSSERRRPVLPEAFLDLVRTRRSHRGAFRKDVPVTDAEIATLMEAARWAPSGGNSQPWEFIVIRDAATRGAIADLFKKQLADKLEMEWVTRRIKAVGGSVAFRNAPVFILALGDPRLIEAYPVRTRLDKWQSHHYTSLASAVMQLMLAAECLGLGTQWVSDVSSPYAATMLKAMLGIPDPLQVYQLIPVGRVSREVAPNPRRKASEFTHHERYDMRKFRSQAKIDRFLATMGIRSPKYRW